MSPADVFPAIEAGDRDRALALIGEDPDAARARRGDGLSVPLVALYQGLRDVAAAAATSAGGPDDVLDAAALGDVDALRRLLAEEPGRVRAWSPDGFTPLHYAVFFGGAEAVEVLVEAGADLEAAATNEQLAPGAHPLHSGVAARAAAACRVLLEAGADPNARAHAGYTPLLEAAQNGDAELVDLLLAFGADSAATLDDGRGAAELAAAAGAEPLAARLRDAPSR